MLNKEIESMLQGLSAMANSYQVWRREKAPPPQLYRIPLPVLYRRIGGAGSVVEEGNNEEACDEPCDSGYSVRRPYEWMTERRPSRILPNVTNCSCCVNMIPLCILISCAEDFASRFTQMSNYHEKLIHY